MKVAIVFDGLGLGGIEKVGADYIKILKELGHEVDIYNLTPSLNHIEEKQLKDYPVIHHSFSKFICPELYSYGIKKWWWGKFAYPIVHTVLSIYLFILKLFRRHRHTEYDVAIAFSGHFNDLTFVANGFVKAKKKLCWIHGALYSYFLIADGYARLYDKIKNLVVLVDDAQDEVMEYNKYLDISINKLYNPTYMGQRQPDEKKVKEIQEQYGEFVLMVARFDVPKDFISVVDAVTILNSEYGIKLNAVFVGDGPDFERVKNYCSQKGVEEQVHLLGAKDDVENYYKAAKVVVLSTLREGLPTVIIEALSMGKPVVAADCKVGPREILGNDEYGLLFPVQDKEGMAKQIHKLISDEDLYNHYVEQGYKRINAFSPENIAKQLEEILQKL